MIVGVTKGYSKKLRLVGVGYRALLDKEKIIDLEKPQFSYNSKLLAGDASNSRGNDFRALQ
jgi:hypothetical protein